MNKKILALVLIATIAFLIGFVASYNYQIQTPFVDVPFTVLAIGLILGGAVFFGYLGFIPALLLGLQLGAEKNAAVFIYFVPIILAIYAGAYLGVLINKDFERKEVFIKKSKNIVALVAITLVAAFIVETAVPYMVEYWPIDYMGLNVGGGYMPYDSDTVGEGFILRANTITIPIELKPIIAGANYILTQNDSTRAVLKIKDETKETIVYGAIVTATSQSGNKYVFEETSSGFYKKTSFPFGEQVTLNVKAEGYSDYNKKVTFNRDETNEILLIPRLNDKLVEANITIKVFGTDKKPINQAKVVVYDKETSNVIQTNYTVNGQVQLNVMQGTTLRIVVEKGSTAAGLIGKLASLKRG